MKKNIKKVNGYSIRTDRQLNNFLTSLKFQTGARSIRELLHVMLKCPQLPSYVFDHFAKTSFEINKETKKAYEKQHNIKKIGMVKVPYVKPKGNKILEIPKDSDLEVIRK